MRKLTTLVLLLLLTACANESTEEVKEEAKSDKETVEVTADVVAAEVKDEKLPWEKYDTQEIYDLVNDGKEVFTLDNAVALENEFFRLYDSGELTSDWGKYLHVFGAELQPNHADLDEYLKTIMNVGVNVMNENYDEANRLMEHAKVLREDAN